MNVTDELAAILWRTEAVDSGAPRSVVAGRTREAFEDQSEDTKNRWRKFARAALSASGAGRASVKPLEWRETSYGLPETLTVVGVYRIVHAGNGGWLVSVKGDALPANDGRTNFATLDDAKAAAQADYERRIMSALHPLGSGEPDRAKPVAYLIERKVDGTGEQFSTSLRFYPEPETESVKVTPLVPLSSEILAEARKALEQAGYVVVPKEPTEAMLTAGSMRTGEQYRAMLAASQVPE